MEFGEIKMVGVNFIGNLLGCSGYNCHVRGLFNAYAKLEKEVHLDSALTNDYLAHLNDTELKAVRNKSFKDGVSVMITMPMQWKLGVIEPHKAFIGFCVWEGDKVPENFFGPLSECDTILVPSNHVKDAINKTFSNFKDKIELVPHGVDSNLFVPKEKENNKFTFIVNKGWTSMQDRGGTQFAVKAFFEEFSSKDNVKMLIKVNPAYGIPDLNKMIGSLIPKGKTDVPELQIIIDNIDYKDMPKVYQQGNVFVSPTMGEAFSIPCAEAMACGLPVITTNFGGQTDYVNNENGYLIDSTLVENKWDLMYEGINWAMPDHQHLKKTLRWAYEHQDEVKQKGNISREQIKNYSWENSAKILYNLLEKFK
jgi:glycosyltransferase involved in cell wall biosynthesis